ncbi:MAG TPA: hypothetical protein VNS19_05910 [Acidimicrobiales bacterium]|jgi:hypothetical protein|nr:hypothetical protein [Acidimicrobiales bacterium]
MDIMRDGRPMDGFAGLPARFLHRHLIANSTSSGREELRASGEQTRGAMMDVKEQHRDAAVAAYATLEGAELAAAHLVGCGHDEEDIRIGPRDYEALEENRLRDVVARWVRAGGITGAGLMAGWAVVAEVGWGPLVDAVLPMLLWGAAAGALVGIVAAFVAHRVRAAHTYFSLAREIEPTRFDVVAERDRDRARNDLARWWNPAAPTAGWDPNP